MTTAARLLLLLSVALAGSAQLRAEDNPFPMKWRVFCDASSCDSFRYPYEFFPVDQYKGDLHRFSLSQPGQMRMNDQHGTDMQGGDAESPMHPQSRVDIHHFAYTDAELTAKSLSTLQSVGDAEAAASLTWKPYAYYESKNDARPFADPRWADEGIEAMIGEGTGVCGLVVRHGAHVSGLILDGGLSSGTNQRVLDSFEVLSVGHKLKKGEKPSKKAHFTDWAAYHCAVGKVIDNDNHLLSPPLHSTPVPWGQTWEIETPHYHITTDFSPSRLLDHAVYVEGLFDAYSNLYHPDKMPPYKFEVHIFNTYREFQEASAAWGDAIPVGPGQIVGGFFQPSLLSLWVYEESGQLGGESFSIEHVMAHECSHQFLHVVCNGSDHIPTWINEGLAVYFEAGAFEGGQFVIKSPTDRINRLKQAYQQLGTTLWPLDKYINHHGFISADMYGEVYAMTMFWVFGTCNPDFATCNHKKNNCGYYRFQAFMKALRNHEDGNQAFENIFMKDMITAQNGDRAKAIALWQSSLMDWVKTSLK
jgi:hypothetical protein